MTLEIAVGTAETRPRQSQSTQYPNDAIVSMIARWHCDENAAIELVFALEASPVLIGKERQQNRWRNCAVESELENNETRLASCRTGLCPPWDINDDSIPQFIDEVVQDLCKNLSIFPIDQSSANYPVWKNFPINCFKPASEPNSHSGILSISRM